MANKKFVPPGAHKVYVPRVNPLPSIKPIRGYVKKDGTTVMPYRRKPPFRHSAGYSY